MEHLAKVKGYDALRKDQSNGGVVNVDTSSYTAYISSRKNTLRQQKEKEEMQNDISELQGKINNMNADISEIKNMLLVLIQKDKQ